MKRFLALGDSYTVGEGVSPSESWPLVLTGQIAKRGLRLGTRIVATTGWTTDELMKAAKADRADKADRAERADRADRYDLVTLLIGVNDQYRGRDLEEYRAGLVPLIHYAIDQTKALRSGRSPKAGHVSAGGERPDCSAVIVISIPNWGRTPFAYGRDRAAVEREIASFNEVAAEEAARAGCAWADIRAVQDADGDPGTLLVGDQLHPSAAAYEAWAEALLPFALAALGRA